MAMEGRAGGGEVVHPANLQAVCGRAPSLGTARRGVDFALAEDYYLLDG
jgi:hypothetical protein